jgi:hypothetical protein
MAVQIGLGIFSRGGPECVDRLKGLPGIEYRRPTPIIIGGYIYSTSGSSIEEHLKTLLGPDSRRIDFSDNGLLFYTNLFGSDQKPYAESDNQIALSEDLHVIKNSPDIHRVLDSG